MKKTIQSAFQNWFGGLPSAVWILAGISFTNRAGSMIISFLTLYLTGPLHFDIATAGEIVLFFGIGGIAGSFVGGYLTDTLGYYKVQWLTLFIAGVVAAVVQYFHNFYFLCGGIFAFSFISEAFRPANNVALMYYSTDEIRTRAYSLLRISVNLAISFALGIGGLLIVLGWRWLFWFDALTSVAAAIVVLIFLPENSNVKKQTATLKELNVYREKAKDKEQNSNVKKQTATLKELNVCREKAKDKEQNSNVKKQPATLKELNVYREKAKDKEQNSNVKIQTATLKELNVYREKAKIEKLKIIFKNSAYSDKTFLLFTFYTFLGAVVFMQIIWTISYFFTRAYGWSEAQAGLMNALNCVFVLIVEMPLIFYLQNKLKPLQVVCIGIVCYALAHTALLLPHALTLLPALIYILFISLGEILVMPFSSTWAAKHGEGLRSGEYMGLYGIAYSFSHIAAPLLGTQIIAHFGFDTLWIILIALSALAFAGFYSLIHRD